MTAIAGVAEEGHVVIGGDSAGVAGWELSLRADGKVFRNGPMLFGFTSSFRMGQLLKHSLSVPPRAEGQDPENYVVTTFIDGVRDCLHRGGIRKKENEVEEGGTFLVGYDGELWCVQSDFQVVRYREGIAAVGAGASVAIGSLWTTQHSGKSAQDRVALALAAAEANNTNVRGPFHIEVV